ncbi:MAG: hypothetical protein LBB39_03210 [Mycoplasmataceae bacterium]|jgi:alanine dehydrogenase|nr:hypothetical protein [Mycoplasmataceae bacterium]
MNVVFLKCDYCVSILPEDVKNINHQVYIQTNIGKSLQINDGEYSKNNAKIFKKLSEIEKIDIIVCFDEKLSGKIIKQFKLPQTVLLTNENFSGNRKMLLQLLKKDVTTLGLGYVDENNSKYLQAVAKIKARFALSIGTCLQKQTQKDKTSHFDLNTEYDKSLYFSILNYSFSSYFLISEILKSGGKVCLLESNKTFSNFLINNEKIKPYLNNLEIVNNEFDIIFEKIKKTNVLVNTTTSFSDSAHLRITTDMVQSMPQNSVYIDLSAEQGFGAETSKKYDTIKKPFTYNYGKPCLTLKNICSFYPKEYAKINSTSISSLLNNFDNETLDDIKFNNLINSGMITFNGKIINKKIAKNLFVDCGKI